MSTTASTAVDKTSEEYSYIQRNEFTSEIYKIEVRNLGIFGIGEFKKLLRNHFSLDASKIKSPHRKEYAFVCFRSLEDQEKALTMLNGYRWKGRELKAVVAKANPDPFVKKRRQEITDNSVPIKRQKTVIEATCPLAHLPYAQQLKEKDTEMKTILKQFGKELQKINSLSKKHCFPDNQELPCEFLGIKPSPVIEGYRNKSELAIGKDSNGKIVVGFRLGSYSDGSVEVGALDELLHISKHVKKAAKTFEEYIQSSKFDIFNPEHNSGHFRQLGVRTSHINEEIMLIAGIYSGNLKEEDANELKNEIREFYKNYNSEEFQCTSLYYQDLKRRDAGQTFNPVEHLLGATHINDNIHGIKFRISPLAFFQINTPGAEVLYQEAINLAKTNNKTTVLDICCGTGTIGLCFAKYCKNVMGVDIIEDAIKDAEFNAHENGIKNCKFYAGNSDDYIQSMVKQTIYSTEKEDLDIVAVVDPPRGGLHNRSILALRNAKGLDRIVYISCNPKSAQRNWIDLARPESKSYKGEPFLPKCAVAVDMFPQTAHTELIVLFERIKNNDTNNIECPKCDDDDDTLKNNAEKCIENNV